MAHPRRTLPPEVREELVVVDWKKTIVEYHETKKRLTNCEMPIGKLAKAIGAMKYIENMARSEVAVRFGEHVGWVDARTRFLFLHPMVQGLFDHKLAQGDRLKISDVISLMSVPRDAQLAAAGRLIQLRKRSARPFYPYNRRGL